MTDFALLSHLALVEKAIARVQQEIDEAKRGGLLTTAYDASGLTVEAIDALARIFRARGYKVQKTVGVTDYRHCYPLLRIQWTAACPNQLPLWE